MSKASSPVEVALDEVVARVQRLSEWSLPITPAVVASIAGGVKKDMRDDSSAA